MTHSTRGNKSKRKRKNSNPTKISRYKVYESPNKENSDNMAESEMVNEDSSMSLSGKEEDVSVDKTTSASGECCYLGPIKESDSELHNLLLPPPAHSNTPSRPDWVEEIFKKLVHIDEKLSKVNEINEKLSVVVERVNTFEADLDKLKRNSGNVSNTIGVLRKTSEEVKGQIQHLEETQKSLEDTVTDLQCRSMRDNLLFFGLAERKNGRENCATLIDDFCENQLGLPSVSENIERAHRLGGRNEERTKPRPIVVKFASYRMREKVREKANRLAGTSFSIQEQFPKKIQEKRKMLIPIMNEARRNRKSTKLVKDKLYIDGVEYTGHSNADA